MTLHEFLGYCTTHGGNWTAMFMSGIREVAPDVFNLMPDRSYSFDEVVFIVNHLCSDRPHLQYNRSIEGQIIEYTSQGEFLYREATDEEKAMSVAEFEHKYNGIPLKDSDTSTINSLELD